MEGVKQGLYPDSVPGQEQPLCPGLPNREGKDAIELMDTGFSILGIGMEQHFRIGMALEAVTSQFHVMPQLVCIIQLPIVNQNIVLPCPAQLHGLLSALRVNDGKTGMEQGRILLPENAMPIGAPAVHGEQHFPDQGFLCR